MKVRTSVLTTSLIAAALFASAPAYADNITWNFGTLAPGLQGQSHDYTVSGATINAQAFGPNGSGAGTSGPVQLFGKTGGGDETGLGLSNDPSGNDEITSGSFVQLDISKLNLLNNVISFQAGSTTTGGSSGAVEGWIISESNASGMLGSQLLTCTNSSAADTHCENPISDIGFMGGFQFLDITSIATGGGNILIAHLDANVAAVPGPIVGAGLPGLIAACGGLLALARRRRQLVV